MKMIGDSKVWSSIIPANPWILQQYPYLSSRKTLLTWETLKFHANWIHVYFEEFMEGCENTQGVLKT